MKANNSLQRFERYCCYAGDCIVWTGSMNQQGYGQFYFDGRMQSAHRVAYEMNVGQVQKDSYVGHRCGNKSCVNVAHLLVRPSRTKLDALLFYTPVTESGCWLWDGPYDHGGYGMYSFGNKEHGHKSIKAHRAIFELFNGDIPPDMQLDHLCRVRCCVNPLHLEIVTLKTNVLRGIGITALNVKKTHCPVGHSYSNENTTVFNGARHCKECGRIRAREYQQRKRALNISRKKG